MAAENSIKLIGELTGIGEGQRFAEAMSTTTVVTKFYHGYQIQAVADTAEALEIGNITTPVIIMIKCIANDVDIDTTYSVSHNAELTINEGEFAIFRPAGTVWIKNDDAAEASTIEVYAWGV